MGLGWRIWLLVLGLLVARWAYLALFCPYSLVEDEAHYWEWSRHLALSYYTKGPGIAWLIAGTTRLFGDTEFGVRAAAPLFSAILTLAAARLVLEITGGDRRKAFYAAAAIQLAPIFQATALLATIDGPYCAFWAIAALAGWRAITHSDSGSKAQARARTAAWIILGFALGVGFLFKYTILLLVPGLIAFARWHRRHSKPARSTLGPMLAAAGFLVAAAPVVIWNQDNDWPTIRHLLGHLGMAENTSLTAPPPVPWEWSPLWVLEFIGTQLGLVGPLLVLAFIAGVAAWRRRNDPSAAGELFLLLCGLPILAFYLLVSFIAQPEGNWPMAGYVTLLPLAGMAAADAMRAHRSRVAAWRAQPHPRPRAGILRRKPESARQVLWHAGVAYGIISGILMLRVDLLAKIPGADRVIPEGRLQQGRILAESVQRLREQIRAERGVDVPVISRHYGRASQLAFYLPDRPVVYSASSLTGGRRTQQDDWPTHSFTTIKPGTVLLLIGGDEAIWTKHFNNVEPLGPVPGVERKGIEAFLGTRRRGK